MAAGMMRDARNERLIDTAGMELVATLLVFDYPNGEPVSILEQPGIAAPVHPSSAAAAIDRSAFIESGGFDEALFAYWEDVDLVLRLPSIGGRCVLVRRTRGTHLHSVTLGPGSAAKNRLPGFGRGYLLRKWGALTPRHVPAVLLRDGPICLGQIVIDRSAGGQLAPGLGGPLARRLRRRRRLRRAAARGRGSGA
jgi:GT2 family glycosyltransferase